MGILTLQPSFVMGSLGGSLGASLPVGCTPASALISSAAANVNFPINAADFATKSGVPAMTPSHIFPCQEGSGPLIDSVNNVLLAAYPFFAISPEMAVATAGLEGGARTAIRLDDNTSQGFQALSTDLMDPFFGSFGWFAVFKCATNVSNRTLLSHGPGLVGADPEIKTGFTSQLDGSGRIGAVGSDGTIATSLALVTTDLCDDTWRIAGGVYNDTADTFTAMHATGSNAQSTAALTMINNHSYFTVGQGVDGGRYPSPPADVTYIVLFEGAAAEAVTTAGLNTFITQAVT